MSTHVQHAAVEVLNLDSKGRCVSPTLISFNIDHAKNPLKQLGFWYHACETSYKFPILEYHIGRRLSNRIFSERLSCILNIQFRDRERVPVL